MDLTTGFASIVALLAQWKSIAQADEARDFDRYIDWLRRQEHQQLVKMILGSDELSRSLRVLVEDQHGEVMAKLGKLDKVLSDVASHIAGFEQMANAVRVNSGLSDQAISILRQMNEANTAEMWDMCAGPVSVRFSLGSHKTLQVDEPRFLEGDLEDLCDIGLLLKRTHRVDAEMSTRVFTITRAGAAVGG